MKKRSSAPARVLASAAVICGFVVVVVVIATSLGGNGGSGGSGDGSQAARHGAGGRERGVPKVYVVRNGDTLTAIAHRTGVPVARIRALNPGVDPQILISGETLKLR